MIVYSFIRHFHCMFRPIIAAIIGYCYSYTKRKKWIVQYKPTKCTFL